MKATRQKVTQWLQGDRKKSLVFKLKGRRVALYTGNQGVPWPYREGDVGIRLTIDIGILAYEEFGHFSIKTHADYIIKAIRREIYNI